jgi:ribosome-binding factor A
MAGLESSIGFLQRQVASRLKLKHTPTVTFGYDDSIDRGLRINEILREEAPTEPDPPEADPSA